MIFFSLDPVSQTSASPGKEPVARVYFCPRAQDRDELVRVIRRHGFGVRSFRRQVKADGVVLMVYVVIVRGSEAVRRALP